MQIFKTYQTIKINSHGGVLPLGKLEKLLQVLRSADIDRLKFGLRQNIFIEFSSVLLPLIEKKLTEAEIEYQTDLDSLPNIMTSYSASNIFSTNAWLTEGVFKEILDRLDYHPSLKINFADSVQALTPVFTGNINWVASESDPNYWHLYIRYPKSNTVLKWKEMIHTFELLTFSQKVENELNKYKMNWGYPDDIEQKLIKELNLLDWNSKTNNEEFNWPVYSLPYYEGINKYEENKYWLGIYRRDEWFRSDFLIDLVKLCHETTISEVCITPWKSLIIKNIDEANRIKWNHLLNIHSINIRHSLNELSFQVEDNNESSLELKNFLVKHLNEDDIRTSGICFGIKSRPKTEVFCNILLRKRALIPIGKKGIIPVYDILLSKDFNPHARTGMIYRKSLFKYLLPEEIHGCIREYYRNRIKMSSQMMPAEPLIDISPSPEPAAEYVFQCQNCKTVLEVNNELFSENLVCPLCESQGDSIQKVNRNTLFV